MISCRLQGGLGNQMFQISAAYSLALDNNDSFVIVPKFHYPRHINGGDKHVNKYKDSILKNVLFDEDYRKFEKIYKEKSFTYFKIPYMKNMLIDGYFQSEKYFAHNRQEIINLFSLDSDHESRIRENYKNIFLKNTVSVHVRRGDYLKYPSIHPTCTIEYYKSSMSSFDENTNFLFFSDDLEWCKENFHSENSFFINENDVTSLFMMTMTEHNIIANSSFSWWGAWLNKNEDKRVIAPKKWFGEKATYSERDLIPEEWTRK